MLHFPLWKKIIVGFVLLWSALVALPNIVPVEENSFLPKKTVNLGLDLQGGAHLVLQVDLKETVKQAYETLEDEIRSILRSSEEGGRIAYTGVFLPEEGVKLTLKQQNQADLALTRLRKNLNGVFIQGEENITVTFTPVEIGQIKRYALEQTLEILRLRVDEFGVAEPLIQRQGEDRVIVELPGVSDISRAKSIIGRTAQLTFHMVDEGARAGHRLPPGTGLFYEYLKDEEGKVVQEIPYFLKKRPALNGENLNRASAGFDQFGAPIVSISFDSRGTRKFADLTRKNVGNRMAIVLDGEVYSAPVLREPILGGNAQISGNFTVTDTQDLATILRAGALPAPIHIVEERTVGPSLGQDSIDAGRIAIVMALLQF